MLHGRCRDVFMPLDVSGRDTLHSDLSPAMPLDSLLLNTKTMPSFSMEKRWSLSREERAGSARLTESRKAASNARIHTMGKARQ